jgi:hypothetical protein
MRLQKRENSTTLAAGQQRISADVIGHLKGVEKFWSQSWSDECRRLGPIGTLEIKIGDERAAIGRPADAFAAHM